MCVCVLAFSCNMSLLSSSAMANEDYQEQDRQNAEQVLGVFHEFLGSVSYEVMSMKGSTFFSLFVYKINRLVTWQFIQGLVTKFNHLLYDIKILFEKDSNTLTFVLQLFFHRELPKNGNVFHFTRHRHVIDDFKTVLQQHFPDFKDDSKMVYQICEAVHNSCEILPVVEVRLVDRIHASSGERLCDIQFVNLGEISYSFLQYLVTRVCRRFGEFTIVPTQESRFELRLSLLPKKQRTKLEPLSIMPLFYVAPSLLGKRRRPDESYTGTVEAKKKKNE